MRSPSRTVRVEARRIGDRTVLAVEPSDQRSFGFGERVYVIDEAGGERLGTVTWDPVARWIVAIEERSPRQAL